MKQRGGMINCISKTDKTWLNQRLSFMLLVLLFSSMSGCSSEAEDEGSRSMLSGGENSINMMSPSGGNQNGDQGGMENSSLGGVPSPPRSGIGVLGYASHSIDEVDWEVIGVPEDGLKRPIALQINPARPNELWVVNYRDDSVVVLFDFDTPERRSRKFTDPYAIHFMTSPTSISFASDGQFATCQDSNNGGDYFMGPTLWTSDFDIFAQSNPDAVAYLSGQDLGSHLDMLHESPHCMGIAWENENQYWVFEGLTSSIARVDFKEDHGPGFDDHSDGVTVRYAVGEVSRMEGFPSHLLYDQDTQKLYIADTGNQRVGVLDTRQEGTGLTRMPAVEAGTQLLLVDDGPQVESLVPEGTFRGPTGLAMYQGILYVSDTANGRITAVDPESGEILDWLDTGIDSPGLMGITFDSEGNLYAVDGLEDRVFRFSPRP